MLLRLAHEIPDVLSALPAVGGIVRQQRVGSGWGWLRPADENDEVDRRQDGLAVGRGVHQVLAEFGRDGELERGEAGR